MGERWGLGGGCNERTPLNLPEQHLNGNLHVEKKPEMLVKVLFSYYYLLI
jgi:hypothetical protein